MQHNRAGRKLGRTTGHRLALFRNQLTSLFTSERIVTTLSKAKELRPLAERMVTQGRRGTVHARRLVGRWVQDRTVLKRLFDEIAPRFTERPGGYLRIVKLGPRQGDGAEMAVLEFVDFQVKKAAAAPAGKAAEAPKRGRKSDEKAGDAGQPAEESKPASKRVAAAGKPTKEVAPKGKRGPAGPAKKRTSAPKKIGGS